MLSTFPYKKIHKHLYSPQRIFYLNIEEETFETLASFVFSVIYNLTGSVHYPTYDNGIS